MGNGRRGEAGSDLFPEGCAGCKAAVGGDDAQASMGRAASQLNNGQVPRMLDEIRFDGTVDGRTRASQREGVSCAGDGPVVDEVGAHLLASRGLVSCNAAHSHSVQRSGGIKQPCMLLEQVVRIVRQRISRQAIGGQVAGRHHKQHAKFTR